MMDLLDTEPFRVYSDREVETRCFAWSPHMDLLASLSVDATNPHVSVWRLIEDKQSNSALLFSEKIPFPGTAVAWVPDKRSLTVGDMNGNVFVYDAECQRSIELQKVQDCAISSIEWVRVCRVDDDITSRFSKLPKLHLPFTTIGSLVGESSSQCDDIPPIIECDSIGCSDEFTVMGVVGVNGKISLYYGGSIPIAETQTSSNSRPASHLYMSPDLSSICITGESDSSHLTLLNSSMLKLRSRELARLGSRLSRSHLILKNINICIETMSRATQSAIEEFQSFYDIVDLEEFVSATDPPDWITSQSLSKFLKLARSSLNMFDYLSVNLCSCLDHWIKHLGMAIGDIVSMSRVSTKSHLLGLYPSLTDPLSQALVEIVNIVNLAIDEFQLQSRVFKWLFFQTQNWIQLKSGDSTTADSTDPLVANMKLSPCDKPTTDLWNADNLNPRKTFDFFSSTLLDQCKKIEESFLAIQSSFRRTLGSQIFTTTDLSFFGGRDLRCFWRNPDRLDITYTIDGDLIYSCIVRNEAGGGFSQSGSRRFKAPDSLAWRLPQLYRCEKICALLEHGQGVSIGLISIDDSLDQETVLTPDMYGVPGILVAQQLPEILTFTGLQVSSNRGLCSIYSTSGRLITLDLEPDPNEDELDDDDVEEDESIASSKSSSGGRMKLVRSKSWFDENKFFNADGLANARRKIKEEKSDSDNSIF